MDEKKAYRKYMKSSKSRLWNCSRVVAKALRRSNVTCGVNMKKQTRHPSIVSFVKMKDNTLGKKVNTHFWSKRQTDGKLHKALP